MKAEHGTTAGAPNASAAISEEFKDIEINLDGSANNSNQNQLLQSQASA